MTFTESFPDMVVNLTDSAVPANMLNKRAKFGTENNRGFVLRYYRIFCRIFAVRMRSSSLHVHLEGSVRDRQNDRSYERLMTLQSLISRSA